jgi:transposase-like protein
VSTSDLLAPSCPECGHTSVWSDNIEDGSYDLEYTWNYNCHRCRAEWMETTAERRARLRPPFPPQCHTHAQPGAYGRDGWADVEDEGRLA